MFKPCPSIRSPYTLEDGTAVFHTFHQPLLESRGPETWRKVPGFPYSVSSHERVRRDAVLVEIASGPYVPHTRTAHVDRRHSSPSGTAHILHPFYLGPRYSRYAAITLSLYSFQYVIPIYVLMAAVGFTDNPEHASRLPKPPRRPTPTPAKFVPRKPKSKPPRTPAQVHRQHELAIARREAIKQKTLAKLSR
jgi:hypothetical protein